MLLALMLIINNWTGDFGSVLLVLWAENLSFPNGGEREGFLLIMRAISLLDIRRVSCPWLHFSGF